jgi:hypothetical protein
MAAISGKFAAAAGRAEALEAKHEADGTRFPQDNPSSAVWRLVKQLGFEY